ncbi:MAG: hypothetical protein OXC09_07650 [Truepera sp.]|nr:hypothetical protein [Truepera sp.]
MPLSRLLNSQVGRISDHWERRREKTLTEIERRGYRVVFDTSYVTVTPDLHFEVSRRVREGFDNSRAYYTLRGQRVGTPEETAQKPAKERL